MARGNWMLSLTATVLLLTIALHARAPVFSQAPSSTPQAPASDYLGSQSCAKCHDVEHAQWKNSLHIKMTKPVAEATILGDFRDGTKFADHDRSYTFGMKDGKPDRKSTRLNSSHGYISYAVFCLKKK